VLHGYGEERGMYSGGTICNPAVILLADGPDEEWMERREGRCVQRQRPVFYYGVLVEVLWLNLHCSTENKVFS
jgi:hypothetical protein